MKYVLLAITFISLSCANDNVTPIGSLEGTWVEKVNRMDTILFDSKLNGAGTQYFIFKGNQGISGYNNLYSTIFQYNLKSDKISLYNTISSCYCFSDYGFSQKGDKIFIENFYDSNSTGLLETFEKLN